MDRYNSFPFTLPPSLSFFLSGLPSQRPSVAGSEDIRKGTDTPQSEWTLNPPWAHGGLCDEN